MPTALQIHRDELLTNVSVKYRNTNYIADLVAPEVEVKKSSNEYRVYSRNFRIPETKRANKAEARQMESFWSYSTYVLEKHALWDIATDDDVENNDIGDLRADITEELTDAILRRREKMVADLITTTSWSLRVSLAAGQAWTLDTSASNPIPVFDTACSVVGFNTGMKPNFAIVPRDSYIAAKNHSYVIDRVKYTSQEISENILAALFGVQELYVPMASYDSAAEGLTETVGSIWAADKAFVGYKPARPGLRVPSAMYTFMKRKPVRRWRDEALEGEKIEVQIELQPKVVASLAGYLINDTI